MNERAVGRGWPRRVERLVTVQVYDADVAIAHFHQLPLLISGGAPGGLLERSAVGLRTVGNSEGQAAAFGADLVNAVQRRAAVASAGGAVVVAPAGVVHQAVRERGHGRHRGVGHAVGKQNVGEHLAQRAGSVHNVRRVDAQQGRVAFVVETLVGPVAGADADGVEVAAGLLHPGKGVFAGLAHPNGHVVLGPKTGKVAEGAQAVRVVGIHRIHVVVQQVAGAAVAVRIVHQVGRVGEGALLHVVVVVAETVAFQQQQVVVALGPHRVDEALVHVVNLLVGGHVVRLVYQVVHGHAGVVPVAPGHAGPQPVGDVLVNSLVPKIQRHQGVGNVGVGALRARRGVQVKHHVQLVGGAPGQHVVYQAQGLLVGWVHKQLVGVVPAGQSTQVGRVGGGAAQHTVAHRPLAGRQKQVVVQGQAHAVEALGRDVVDVGLGNEVVAVALVEVLHRRVAHAGVVEHLLHGALRLLAVHARPARFDDVALL